MIDKTVKGQWALAKDVENTAIYGRPPDGLEICGYCGGGMDGLNLFHEIDRRVWHLRCVVKELERRRGL
jgi:hypothetical protein